MTVPQTSPFGSGDLKTTGARHFQHTVCIDYKSARFIFVLKVMFGILPILNMPWTTSIFIFIKHASPCMICMQRNLKCLVINFFLGLFWNIFLWKYITDL